MDTQIGDEIGHEAAQPEAPPVPKTFDLTSVPVSDVAELTVLHPTTEKLTGWKIQLAGPGHPQTITVTNESARERATYEREQSRELALALARGRKVKLPEIEVDVEGDRARFIGRTVRRILGWSPVTFNGADFPYSPGNALLLLKEPRYSWVATQIYDFLAEDVNFIGSSAKT